MQPFWVYILGCQDGSYYVGHTDDLQTRLARHQAGEIASYTRSRRPVVLIWSEQFSTRIDAIERERQLKGWSRAKKQALIVGDWAEISRLAVSHQRASTPRQLRSE
jgi:predicted GIY-YIG superfamily endonuclease